MDLSKLKPMSQTPPAPPPIEASIEMNSAPPIQNYVNPSTKMAPPTDDFGLVSIWISGVMAVICLFLGQRFGSWLISYIQNQPFHTNVTWQSGELAGTEVAYFDLSNYTAMTEAGLLLLGIVLLIDVALMLLARRGMMSSVLISIALVLILVTTVFNIYVTMLVYKSGVLPLFSLMAVLTAGIVFFGHLDSLKLLKHHRELLKRAEQAGATDVAK